MRTPIREKRHRLDLKRYIGRVKAAFTIDAFDNQPWFNHPATRKITFDALEEAFAKHGGHTGICVMMPDHLHLVLSGGTSSCNLLTLLNLFKQLTTYRVHKEGYPFRWQKDYWDHLIHNRKDYAHQVRYVLRNPVRKGWVTRWQDWPHRIVLGQSWDELVMSLASSND